MGSCTDGTGTRNRYDDGVNKEVAMKALRDIPVQELIWVQPSRRKRTYELHGGDEALASLRFEKRFGGRAVATTAEGEWHFQKSGWLKPRVTVRRADSNLNVAVFHCKWGGGGTLSFCDGGIYYWNHTSRLHTAWAWTSPTKQPLLQLKRRTMTVESADVTVPNLVLLA
jgi:hypothetical protein